MSAVDLTVRYGSMLKIPASMVSSNSVFEVLADQCVIINTRYILAQKEGVTGEELEKIPRVIKMWYHDDNYMYVPRHVDLSLLTSVYFIRKIDFLRRMQSRCDPIQTNIMLRDSIQEEAYNHLVTFGDKSISLACGRGKTIIALKGACDRGLKTLVIVPTTELAEQWIVDGILGFTDFGKKEPFIPGIERKDVGFIGGGRRTVGKRFTVGIINTLAIGKGVDSLANEFDLVIFDEIHRYGTEKFHLAASKFDAERWGLSVSGDTRIVVKFPEGRVENFAIKDLYSKWEIGILDCSKDGLLVRAYSEEKNLFVWAPLKYFHRHKNIDRKCIKFKTKYGRSIIMTECHSAMPLRKIGYGVRDTHTVGKYKLKECRGSEVTQDDLFLLDNTAYEGSPQMINGIFVEKRVNRLNSRAAIKYDKDLYEYYFEKAVCSGYTKSPLYKIRYAWVKHAKVPSIPLCLIEPRHYSLVDYMYVPGSKDTKMLPEIPMKNLAWFLGFYTGDGWLGTNNNVCFAVNKSRINKFLREVSLLEVYFGHIGLTISDKGIGSIQYVLGNIFLYDAVASLVLKVRAHEKILPKSIFSETDEIRRIFVDGLIASDGHLSERERNKKRYYYTTSSKILAQQILSLLMSLGVTAGVSERKPCKGGIIDGRQIIGSHFNYQINWSKYELDGTSGGYKGVRTPEILYECGGLPVKIRSIEEAPKEEYVYDLTVDGAETFVGNDILVHNSATINRSDRMDVLFKMHVGETVYTNLEQDLTSKLLVASTPYGMDMSGADFPTVKDTIQGRGFLATMLLKDSGRTDLIADMIVAAYESGRNGIVLTNRKDFLLMLREMLLIKGVPDTAVGLIYSAKGVTAKDKAAAKLCRIVIAIDSMVREGFDRKDKDKWGDFDTIFMTIPLYGENTFNQVRGRIERSFSGKWNPIVIVYADSHTLIRSQVLKIRKISAKNDMAVDFMDDPDKDFRYYLTLQTRAEVCIQHAHYKKAN